MTEPRHLLVVCYGNLCRSPMAEGLFGHHLPDGWRVSSAGTHAVDGQPPAPLAREVARREHGVEIGEQRSRGLTVEAVRAADHLFTMSRQQARVAAALAPECRDRIRLLGAFAPADDEPRASADPGGSRARRAEIPDPIGGDYEEYRACAARLEAAVRACVRWLRQGADPGRAPAGSGIDT